MSRYSSGSSYRHTIQKFGDEDFLISWTVDYYYSSSRLRFPRRFGHVTDEKGARRFAKRWKLTYDFGETK